MSKVTLGAICGMVFGAIAVAAMIPLKFEDKTAAMTGAFINRFAVGFVIGAGRLDVPSWAQGLIFGLLLSLPDAIITKAYAPILIMGTIGGIVIGVSRREVGRLVATHGLGHYPNFARRQLLQTPSRPAL